MVNTGRNGPGPANNGGQGAQGGPPSRKSSVTGAPPNIPTVQQRRESLTGQSSMVQQRRESLSGQTHQRKTSVERPPSRKNSLTSPFFNSPANTPQSKPQAPIPSPRTTPPPQPSPKPDVPPKKILSKKNNPQTPTTPTTPSTLEVPPLMATPNFPRIDLPDKTPGSPRMSSKSKKKHRQRIHRHTSNVFSMFNQAQIQEFKEAFNMIDQNRDGFIDKDDLIEIYTSLGKNPTDNLMDMMLGEAPGPINFTMFLTLFGEKLNGTDPEDVIKNAFACFDIMGRGELTEEYLREIMTTMGDRWSHDMVDELLFGVPIKNGQFDYIEFTRTLKHGAKERDEKADEQVQQPKSPGPSRH